jgi:hypothetical protein
MKKDKSSDLLHGIRDTRKKAAAIREQKRTKFFLFHCTTMLVFRPK